jgi:hypothetical protein
LRNKIRHRLIPFSNPFIPGLRKICSRP